MELTHTARERLAKLLERGGPDKHGFRFEGALGSCHASTPVLKPAARPEADDRECMIDGIVFFVPPAEAERFECATLDYDPSFMGRGLNMTWPHQEGCQCQARSERKNC